MQETQNALVRLLRQHADRRHSRFTLPIRTLVLLMMLPLVFVLACSSILLLRSMHRIEDNTNTARRVYLPGVLDNHRTALNLEAMRRHAVTVYLEPDPEERRKARISAQTLGAEIMPSQDVPLRAALSEVHDQFSLLEAQQELAEESHKDVIRERLDMEAFVRHFTWNAMQNTGHATFIARLQGMPLLYALQDNVSIELLQQVENRTLNLLDELSIIAPTDLHQGIDTLRMLSTRTIDAYSANLLQTQRARMLKTELDVRLRSLRDELNVSALDNTYATLISIETQVSWMKYAVYGTYLFTGIAILALTLLTHSLIIKPVMRTSAKLQDIRTGQDSPPLPAWRIDELNEVATLINISGEQIAYLYHHTRELEREKEKIESIAITDGLTGLYNRRYFDIQLQVLREDALIKRSPLSVIMMDIDLFKVYNDNLGHPAGDECLIQVARAIESSLQRKTDMAFRYGGEEFVVLLPTCPALVGLEYAERIREHVQDLGIIHPDSPVSPVVTVSVGVSTLDPDHPMDGKRLLDLADSALYQAKTEGRNRVRAAAGG